MYPETCRPFGVFPTKSIFLKPRCFIVRSNVPPAEKTLFGYVIAAIDISSLKANGDRIKSMTDYLLDHFRKIERGGTALSFIHPISFILRKMIKANCFKGGVVASTLASNTEDQGSILVGSRSVTKPWCEW